MPKLKKLIVVYCGDKSLVWLTALIRASPCLEEFDLHYGQFKWYQLPREYRPAKNPIRIPHHRLNVFKFSGYYGSKNDDELLGYILENCVVLEKYKILDVERSARNKAKEKLQPCVPHHVELVILDRGRREHR
ncbi:hypothetical protein MIMGU_mgv1a016160mg [Erythranthe guttata]|uniref:FBD domain-containing protein n=1 Tax=Erythranthe guttata TaxID=4155 RepID=A0A022RSL1_ERYGU|nr:hypothetical protein MIMGU_mgv1a016160mg [Erythranthe guttata]